MRRQPSRGRDRHFDTKLVDLVDGLFESAARAREGRNELFGKGGNNKYQPSLVRLLFNITPAEMKSWRLQDWVRAGADRPSEFADTLLRAFDPAQASSFSEAALIEKVHKHWAMHCPDELADATRRLKLHRADLEQKHFRQPLTELRGTIRDSEPRPTARREAAASVPLDLSPPPCPDAVSRPTHQQELRELAETFFGVVIEGRRLCGKRYLAQEFAVGHARGRRLLWYRLGPESTPANLFARLSSVDDPLDAAPADAGAALIEWLSATDTLLVLDGIDHPHQDAFAPLLRLVSRIPGPARLIVTSSVKTTAANAHLVGSVTAEEACAMLTKMGAGFSVAEIEAATRATSIVPHALRQAATLYQHVDRKVLARGVDALNTELVRRAPPHLRSVIEVLQAVDGEFDRPIVQAILEALGMEAPPQEVMAELEALLLISPTSVAAWRLEALKTDPAPISIPASAYRAVLSHLADHYTAKAPPGRRDLTREDCANLFTACRLLQLANVDPMRRAHLRSRFTSAMEMQGEFRRLVPLYQFELRDGRWDDPWLPLKLARAKFAQGLHQDALEVLKPEILKALRTQGRDENLHLSRLRLLAEILIEADDALLAAKILDGALVGTDVKNLGSMVAIQAVSVLSWALVNGGLPQECIELSDEILDRRFQGLATAFSRQVSNVRIGVALRALGRLTESGEALEDASQFFAGVDARAYAWSTLHFAVTLDQLGLHALAGENLRAAMDANAAHDLFHGEMQAIYDAFLRRPDRYGTLAVDLKREHRRISDRETARKALVQQIRTERLLDHILLDLGTVRSAPYVFDLETYAIFNLKTPFAMASHFNRTLLNRHRSEGAEETLDRIFASKPPTEIFQTPLYNRLIVDTCKDRRFLAGKYLYPHLDLIAQQSDSVLFLFARCLEALGDASQARELLERVRDKSDFSYFNIKANCLAKSAPFEALSVNDKAIEASNSDQQRAQVLHNKAQTVYDHGIRHMFPEARAWCEEAIRLGRKPKFYWPRNLLLKLRLATCALEEVEQIVLAHAKQFRVPQRALREILSGVKRRSVREVALTALEALVAQPRSSRQWP